MTRSQEPRGPGRPKSEAKREAILTAGRDLLLEHGYSQTSMEMVATAAGVGKPTLYSHFGSKEELFNAIIAVREKALIERLGDLANPTDDPQADLESFAIRFQEAILNPRARLWDRLVIAEAGRHPKLAQKLFKAGPTRVLATLQTYIEKQIHAGLLQSADPSIAAEHLLSLLLGVELLRGQMASQPRRTAHENRKRAEAAIATFLAAYGVEGKGGRR